MPKNYKKHFPKLKTKFPACKGIQGMPLNRRDREHLSILS
jgi:hypothetical protein